ncbi:hypothetical protein [Telluria beijingensis]|uniref:hypothetical protein n=1 Tax=Telluria beijingensis TaxID=3068633 RepID=UPI0027955626|nr:hypothetical protein [Massilia sp. REN29]
MLKKITNGDLIPRYYGIAWFSWQTGGAVCLPLGLNVLAALTRAAYFSVKHAGRIVKACPRDAYAQGVRDGRASAPQSPHIEPTWPWPRA